MSFRLTFPALSLFLAVAPAGALLLPAAAPLRAGDAFQIDGDEFNTVVERARPAIVRVESGNKDFPLAGTGFFIDGQGTVLTSSSSIIGGNSRVRVIVDGLALDAQVLGNDPRSGLAMLKAEYEGSPFLALGHSLDLKTGNAVITLGYPLDLPLASAQGPIGGFAIRYLNRFFATTQIHAGVPISPGQVGGPLLDPQGEVVGLIVPSPDNGRSAYALPVEAMKKIMDDFAQYGRARHGWVGVIVVEAPDTAHDGRTVRVVEAVPGTPASRSGILPGDTVLRLDSREIYRPADVLDASFFSHVGATMTVVVRRDQKLYDYSFAVIERPPNSPAARAPLTRADEPPAHSGLVQGAGARPHR